MINKITLVGRLGGDPEIRQLDSGAAVGKFSVATRENYKDKSGEWQEQTEWHEVVVWRNLAERAGEHLRKGDLVYLEGKLTHRKWQDKDGNPRKTTEVVANYFRRLNKRDSSYLPNEEPAPRQAAPPPRKKMDAAPNTLSSAGATGAVEEFEEPPF